MIITDLLNQLLQSMNTAEANDVGFIFCGGNKFFSNGLDLEWALKQTSTEIETMFLRLGECILRIMEVPKPVVGAIKGYAIGGGMALLMSCDYRFGATGRVLIGKPETQLGVPNPYYGDQLFRFIAGDFVASDMIYTGRLITVTEAVEHKIMHGTEEREYIEARAMETLRTLTHLAPEAFAESKRMRNEKFCLDVRNQLKDRVRRQTEIFCSPETQKLLRAGAAKLAR